jgi:hypothetical protein
MLPLHQTAINFAVYITCLPLPKLPGTYYFNSG